MSDANPPKITPEPVATHRVTYLPAAPSRAEFERATRSALKRGESDKADLWSVTFAGQRLVVKDFSDKRWWVRALGRLQLAREERAYRSLGPTPGLPHFAGRIDAHALAIARIDGEPLGLAADRARDGAEKLNQIRLILDRMHAHGMVHWDLRSHDNVLVDAAGRVWVIDLASAVRLRPGGVAHRLLFRWLRLIDESAYLKWKQILEAGPLSTAEREFLERFRFWRRLWFHRSKAWRKGKRTRL